MKKILMYSIILLNLFQPIAYAITPADILPDSIDTYVGENYTARKGSVGATLLNLKTLEALLKQPQSVQRDQDISKIKSELVEIAPTLIKLKLFELFPLHEWKNPSNHDPIQQAKKWFYVVISDGCRLQGEVQNSRTDL
ncbi:MAG: hypothetical protein U1E78_01800 [Gammaproteobacteria bacterium]